MRMKTVGLVALLSACGSTHHVQTTTVQTVQPPVAGSTMYTLVNLRTDRRHVVVSVNYTEHPLLPVCTPVTINVVRGREIRFTSAHDNVRFRFIRHRSSRLPIEQHAQRLFGPSCPDLASMSPEDQSGIQNGRVYQHMTRAGVIIAMGYPPEHRTQTLNESVWRYWRTRMGQMEVYFTGDQVSGLRDFQQERTQQRTQRRAAREAQREQRRQQRAGVVVQGEASATLTVSD